MRGAEIGFLTIALFVAARASAQPTAAQMEEARQRFDSGVADFDQGNFSEALGAFEQAYNLMEGHPNQGMIQFNIARTQEQLGRPEEALASYRRFLEEAPGDAANRNIAVERITMLQGQRQHGERQQDDRTPQPEASPTPPQRSPAAVETRTEGHFANWIIAGALAAVAVPAIAVATVQPP